MPLNAISRVIGRGGSNINAIRCATGAHIEVEKQSKGQGERIITIKYVIWIKIMAMSLFYCICIFLSLVAMLTIYRYKFVVLDGKSQS